MESYDNVTESTSRIPLVLVLGELTLDCISIDHLIPDGIICFIEGTHIGQLAFECATRRGILAVGIGCEKPEDEEYMHKFLETWITKCDYTVILTHNNSEIWQYARGYSKALGKITKFRTVKSHVKRKYVP